MQISQRFASGIAFGLMTAIASGADWGQFRGPRGDGIVIDVKLPTTWNEGSGVAWKVRIPGRGWSQPAVANDRVIVTTAVCDTEEKPRRGERGIIPDARDARQDDYQWKVMCLSAETGDVLWQETVHEGKPVHRKHRSNTFASETPATDGERIVCYFGMHGVTCFDMSGKRLWSKNLGPFPMQASWGSGSSPVIYKNSVLIQCDNDQSSFLVSLDAKTGDEQWRKPRDEKSNWSTPYIWKNGLRTELVTSGGHKIRSYDPENGKLLWEMAGSGRTSITPVGDDELIYIDSVDGFQGSPGRLAAIRAGATGDISLSDDSQTSSDFVVWSVMLNSYRNASPLLFDGGLYMLEQAQGIVRCFDAKTGKMRYQDRVPDAVGFTASPYANDGKIFLMDEMGLTVAIAPGSKLNVLSTSRLEDDLFWASAAVHGDRLVLRGMNHLYCIRR